MIEGAFSFFLLLFASPQQVVSNQLEGYWLVTIDSTEQVREWNRIYYFEKCAKSDRKVFKCGGHYGWAEFDGVYLNLYDKNFLSYGVERNKRGKTGKRRIFISDIEYDFVLNTAKKTLTLIDPQTVKIVMEMRKVTRSELKKSEEF